MVKVITKTGFDYVKRELLDFYVKVGYVLALA